MFPGVLVDRLAEILGLPSKSIVVVDRALLEAGLRTRGGRGRSAARVTVADAATLLLAVMVTPVLVRADEVIPTWRKFKSLSLPPSAPEPFGSVMQRGAPLPLLTLMEGLIRTPPEDYHDSSLVLEASVDQHAAMLYVRKGGKRLFEVGFARYLDPGEDATMARLAARGDLTRHAKVSEVTFHELHRLFYPAPDTHAAPAELERRA